jgi:RNA polymerase sigma-70 factor (ECF subfamily)
MSRRYRQWVKQYQDQAWTVARYILKDAQEAEDATQEAFVKLWHNQDSIDPERVGAWLMKVTRNGCLDRLRRRKEVVEFDESYMGVCTGPGNSCASNWPR